MNNVLKAVDAVESRIPRFEFCCISFRSCAICVTVINSIGLALLFYVIFFGRWLQRVKEDIHQGGESAVLAIMACVVTLPMILAVFVATIALVIGIRKENTTYLRAYVIIILVDAFSELFEFMVSFFVSSYTSPSYIKTLMISMTLDFVSAIIVHSYRVSITRKLSSQEALHNSEAD